MPQVFYQRGYKRMIYFAACHILWQYEKHQVIEINKKVRYLMLFKTKCNSLYAWKTGLICENTKMILIRGKYILLNKRLWLFYQCVISRTVNHWQNTLLWPRVTGLWLLEMLEEVVWSDILIVERQLNGSCLISHALRRAAPVIGHAHLSLKYADNISI